MDRGFSSARHKEDGFKCSNLLNIIGFYLPEGSIWQQAAARIEEALPSNEGNRECNSGNNRHLLPHSLELSDLAM